MVGKVLIASPDRTSPGPYIPTFYQDGQRVRREGGNSNDGTFAVCICMSCTLH